MIVIDASLALDIALPTPDGGRLLERLRSADGSLGAPEVIDLEVLQVLRRHLRLERIDGARAEAALEIFESLPIDRFSHRLTAARIWALRDNLTAYDAAYFALAELLQAPLWTRDAKFLTVPSHAACVEVL